jgi:TonB family protein
MSIAAQAQTQEQAKNVDAENQRTVKEELDECASAIAELRFVAAQSHADRALFLDAENEDAQLFLARALHAWFDSDGSDKNRAREAIAAYQAVTARNPGHEEAYEAVLTLYEKLGEPDLQYSWALQRAVSADLPVAKRVEAYTFLAQAELTCSFRITFSPGGYDEEEKEEEQEDEESTTVYKMPKKPAEFEKAEQCALRGMHAVDTAIALQPANDRAWSARSSLLREMSTLAEMDGRIADAAEYGEQADEAVERSTKMRSKREDAEWAKCISVDCGEFCDSVISAPKPIYPAIARQARAFGSVTVQITIDEQGQVTEALAIGGHPLLRSAAVQAAKNALFQPRLLSGRPVELTYTFELLQ